MRNVWRIFALDCRHLVKNVIALVVVVGLVVIPSLYAWFNIAAEWDPYSNTSGITVAVANDDEGYESDLMPLRINVGSEVEGALRANDQLDWVFTNSDDAREGVRSGKYYAALVIPKGFSADMLSVLSSDARSATIEYDTNQKTNVIAPEVTNQGADTVRTQVNSIFTQTVSEVGGGIMTQLARYLNGDEVGDFANSLDESLTQASDDLRQAASRVSGFAGLVTSAQQLLDGTDGLLADSGTSTQTLQQALAEGADGVEGLGDALGGASGAVDSAVDRGAASFDAVESAIDTAFSAGSKGTSDAAATLRGTADAVEAKRAEYQARADDLRATLGRISSTWPDFAASAAGQLLDATVSGLASQLDGVAQTHATLRDRLNASAGELEGAVSTATQDQAQLKQLVSDAKGQVASVRGSVEASLSEGTDQLADAIDRAAGAAGTISQSLSQTVESLRGAGATTSDGLAGIAGSLTTATNDLGSTADDLDALHAQLRGALDSGDLEQVRTVIGSDPSKLAGSLAAPVGLERKEVWPIANNGSSMAPYFTTLAIWVGCLVLSAMMRVAVSDRMAAALGVRSPGEAYFGRLLLFALMSLAQTTLLVLGDLFYLHIQCESPLMFLGAAWLASFVFMNIVYALVASFGDVGKAIGVVLLVVQVAGSGGIFPVEVMPEPFQLLYPFLPFVQCINAMKVAIAGGLPGEYLLAMVRLAAFLIPALLLGLVLRKPVIRLNRWIARQLESTKVM